MKKKKNNRNAFRFPPTTITQNYWSSEYHSTKLKRFPQREEERTKDTNVSRVNFKLSKWEFRNSSKLSTLVSERIRRGEIK